MKEHFLFDFETLGQDASSCPVLDVAYYTFDWDRFSSTMEPYHFSELTKEIKSVKFSVEDQMRYKYKIEKSTLEWWSSQSAHAKDKIKPSTLDQSLSNGVDEILEYVSRAKKINYWWSRSNTFDPIILHRICRDTQNLDQFNRLLKYWAVRDTRTYIDAKFNFTVKNSFCPFADEAKWSEVFKPHDSSHDVAAEIMRLQAIVRGELELDQINS